jgi:small subunit ribosomal protein S17
VNQTTQTTEATAAPHALKGSKVGVVTSVSGQKTIKVRMLNLVQETRYSKYVQRQTKLSAHDEKSEAKLGDTVEIAQCRPMSKTKSWRLVRVVKQASI